MCGISGFIDSTIKKDEAEKIISRMLESISHRGPDARDFWIEMPVALGHNRLSIIDLSKDGNQPMHFFDCTITYNGEIYNYIEVREQLRAEGYSFQTQSDTEVILAAYHAYGRECVNKFVGMWAFALWDKKKQELFCSRDRFGIKPFYYILDGGRFYFGSEYKALKQTPIFSNDLNLDQVSRGLQLGWVCYEDETYYSKLKALPAAHNLIYKNGKIEIEKYWDIDLTKSFSGSEKEKEERFKSLFLDSVKLHMRADVEVGGCLSGGLDSSSIACGISKLFPDLKFKTFTIFYEGKDDVDERPWVDTVLKSCPSLIGYDYTPDIKEIPDSFEKTLFHSDVPITGSSPVSQYFVMKLAKEHRIKVILDGQGSDEYLAGYMHSFYRLIGGLFKNLKWKSLLNEFSIHSQMQGFTIGKSADVLAKGVLAGIKTEDSLYKLEYRNYYPFLSNDKKNNFSLDNKNGSRLNQFLYHLSFNTSLPSLLHFEDRNSMAFSIESRVPFLDHRLVEFVFSLNDSDKFKSGVTKSVLRKSLTGILPDKIRDRRDKKGFVTPGEIKWLRGPLKYLVDGMDFGKLGFLNITKTKKIINDFSNGNDANSNIVWRSVVLNHWLKNNS